MKLVMEYGNGYVDAVKETLDKAHSAITAVVSTLDTE